MHLPEFAIFFACRWHICQQTRAIVVIVFLYKNALEFKPMLNSYISLILPSRKPWNITPTQPWDSYIYIVTNYDLLNIPYKYCKLIVFHTNMADTRYVRTVQLICQTLQFLHSTLISLATSHVKFAIQIGSDWPQIG